MSHSSALLFRKLKKGFSTAEVILSMFVLSVGLITVMNLIYKSRASSLDSRDIIIGAELAQEGVELVRNVRDNDFADGGDGFGPFEAFNSPHKHCIADYRNNGASLDCAQNQGSITRYHLQYQGGFYGHYSTTAQIFSRYIYIHHNQNQSDALVRSFVYWDNPTGSSLPANGSPAGCTPDRSCVYTELYLTSWK